jgi:hypothetical protein
MNIKEILETELKKADIKCVELSKGNYGRAWIKERKIKIPEVKSLSTLAVALHEIGHIVLGKIEPQYLCEYKTEMFVREKFKEYGLPLKRRIANRQKKYIAYRVGLSMKHRKIDFKVNPEVNNFITA